MLSLLLLLLLLVLLSLLLLLPLVLLPLLLFWDTHPCFVKSHLPSITGQRLTLTRSLHSLVFFASVNVVCDLIKTLLLIAAASLLALVLVLTEFAFIKKVSSLGLCIIGVVKVSCFLF